MIQMSRTMPMDPNHCRIPQYTMTGIPSDFRAIGDHIKIGTVATAPIPRSGQIATASRSIESVLAP